MNNIKNGIIALLTGLLALSLFTQPAQSATVKTYDAVKLIKYESCLSFYRTQNVDSGASTYQGQFQSHLSWCDTYRP